MTLLLNGEKTETGAGNILELLRSLKLPTASLLVEHNGLALHREEWPLRVLQPDDRIEIIRIVAGG